MYKYILYKSCKLLIILIHSVCMVHRSTSSSEQHTESTNLMDTANNKYRSQKMLDIFAILFHAILLTHHVFVCIYSNENIDYRSTNTDVTDMERFRYRYLTTWNLILQMLYLTLAVSSDTLKLLGYGKSSRALKYLEKVRGFLFTSLVFPVGLFVSFTFWTMFNINRELIFPQHLDRIVPSWVNHSIHSVIILLPFVEFLFRKKIPNLKRAMTVLVIYTTIYYSVYFLTYYESSRWLYRAFDVFSWNEKFGFVMYSYFFCGIALWIGVNIQKYIKNKGYQQMVNTDMSKKLL